MAEVRYCPHCHHSTGDTPVHVCSTFPIIIFEDRYGGSYSRGKWIAVASGMSSDWEGSEGLKRFDYIYANAFDGDPDASNFWRNLDKDYPLPDWVAVGNTPQEALDRLKTKFPF